VATATASTGSPVVSTASWQKRVFLEPSPTMCTTLKASHDQLLGLLHREPVFEIDALTVEATEE
jgi:hypothetical protein